MLRVGSDVLRCPICPLDPVTVNKVKCGWVADVLVGGPMYVGIYLVLRGSCVNEPLLAFAARRCLSSTWFRSIFMRRR